MVIKKKREGVYESIPYRCPVCGGNGIVSNGFYRQTSGYWSTSSADPENCRSCDGSGIIWDKPKKIPKTIDSILSVDIYDGKYTVIQDHKGNLRALRYGKQWRDCNGDGLILALAQEVNELRQKIDDSVTRAYQKVSDYMLANAEELDKEAYE